jgi:hypothetical protein
MWIAITLIVDTHRTDLSTGRVCDEIVLDLESVGCSVPHIVSVEVREPASGVDG